MTSASALAAPRPEGRSWTHVLVGAVRPEFRAEVYVPDPGDRVLAARAPTDAQLERGPAERCAVGACRRSVYLGGLCRSHRARWHRAGRPALEGFVAGLGAVNTRHLVCDLPGCGFPVAGLSGLCDTHHRRYTSMCRYHPGLEPADYIAGAGAARRPRPKVRLAWLGTRAGARVAVRGAVPSRRARRGADPAHVHDGRRVGAGRPGRLAVGARRLVVEGAVGGPAPT